MSSSGLKITVLVDNHAGKGLAAEHGLSLWIEIGDRKVLFDTGQGGALEPNTRTLGVDLAEADLLVLSHGHYDHTGGIPFAVRCASDIHVYCHPGTRRIRYSVRDGRSTSIGLQAASLSALDALPPGRLHLLDGPTELSEGIHLTGAIPRETAFEDAGGPFFFDSDGTQPDPIEDDLALWAETEGGLVACVGCCHAGLVNTLSRIQHLKPGAKIRAIIGGFHLLNASRERLVQTVAALREYDLAQIIPCHCTGETAVAALREAFGKRVTPGASGMTLQF